VKSVVLAAIIQLLKQAKGEIIQHFVLKWKLRIRERQMYWLKPSHLIFLAHYSLRF